MDTSSAISAFQTILLEPEFGKPGSFEEDFAQKRYLKKMERPDSKLSLERASVCWNTWIQYDGTLPQVPFGTCLRPHWYKARARVHKALANFRLGDVEFSDGSEFYTTRGFGSIEAKLSNSKWTCSRDCFDLWAETAWGDMRLRRATRKRFKRLYCKDSPFALRSYMRRIWGQQPATRHPRERAFVCFKSMLSCVTYIQDFNRFSTVRKNNAVDRPICVENLCNMLVQRRIGLGLKAVLRDRFSLDLETAAMKHRFLISDLSKATIDLSNASDGISLALVKFMVPDSVFKLIDASRAQYTLGPDNHAHITRKCSSMGNGFTFELMTLIFLALCQSYDEHASVFGDDMIISTPYVDPLIEDLTSVGLLVNSAKSFWEGPFRESCGANYHEEEGYLKSFDFEYPENIGECISIANKLWELSHMGSFSRLLSRLVRHLPKLCKGGPAREPAAPGPYPVELPPYYVGPSTGPGIVLSRRVQRVVESVLGSWHCGSAHHAFYGFHAVPGLRSPTLTSLSSRRHWAKYAMYLSAGARVKDVVSGSVTWVPKVYVSSRGRVYQLDQLLSYYNRSRE